MSQPSSHPLIQKPALHLVTKWQPDANGSAHVAQLAKPFAPLPTLLIKLPLNTDNAREIVKSLEAIEQFITVIVEQSPGSRTARHDLANALQLCELFKLEAHTHSHGDDVLAKVHNLRNHLCSLAGAGEPDDHSRHQHHVWALEAVSALRVPLTRMDSLDPI